MIPYTTIPFVSAFFLVLVGVLIGQVFWSQFRSRHRQLIWRLQSRSRLLNRELKGRGSELNELRKQASVATEQVRVQAHELESLNSELAILRREQQEMTSRLSQEVQARNDVAACLQDERDQRTREVCELRAVLVETRREVASAHEENASWQTQVQRLRDEIAEKLAEIERLSKRLSEATQFADACHQDQKQLHEERQVELRQAQFSRDRIQQMEADTVALRTELQAMVEQKDSLNFQLDAIHGALRQREMANRVLQADVDRTSLQRDEFKFNFDRLQQQHQLLSEEVEDLLKQRDEMKGALANQQNAFDKANRAAADELENELSFRRQAEVNYERIKAQLSELRQETDRLARVEDQLVDTEAVLHDAKDELKRLRREHEAVIQAESATRQIVTELRDELTANSDGVETLRRERDTAVSQFECERRQRQQLEEAFGQAEIRLASLQSENDAWSQHHAKLAAQTAELSEQLQHWQTRAHESQQRNERAQRQIDELAKQLESQQQLSDKMRRRRFVSLDNSALEAERTSFSFRELRLREQESPSEGEPTIKVPLSGEIPDRSQRRQDDLKKIPGIADRLEKRLHQIGVFTYRQIMGWDEQMIAKVSQQLDLGDLIRSHDWVGQAQRLSDEGERHVA